VGGWGVGGGGGWGQDGESQGKRSGQEKCSFPEKLSPGKEWLPDSRGRWETYSPRF